DEARHRARVARRETDQDRRERRILEGREDERAGEPEDRPEERESIGGPGATEPGRKKERQRRLAGAEDELRRKEPEAGARQAPARRPHGQPGRHARISGTCDKPTQGTPFADANSRSPASAPRMRAAALSVAA